MKYSRNQEDKIEKSELIINAARNIFINKGYAAATIRDIAKESRQSVGIIYVYFKGGKDELFAELYARALNRQNGQLRIAARTKGTTAKRLCAIAKANLSFTDMEDSVFTTVDVEEMKLPDSIKSRLREITVEWENIICSVFKEGKKTGELRKDLNPMMAALSLLATIEGLHWFSRYGYLEYYKFNIDKMIDKHISLLINGMKSL